MIYDIFTITALQEPTSTSELLAKLLNTAINYTNKRLSSLTRRNQVIFAVLDVSLNNGL